MSALAATLLLAGWQASAVVTLVPPPGVCALRYDDAERGLAAVVETRDTGTQLVTAFAISGAGIQRARLVTANFDSAIRLKPVPPLAGEALRMQAALDESDSAALLVHDLSNAGGRIELQRRGRAGIERLELPHPLPRREVVSRFLFCVTDLQSLRRSPAPE